MIENNNTLIKSDLRKQFIDWVSFYNPDSITRTVLSNLLEDYENGKKDKLFLKFNQLIKDEHYILAILFRDCLIHLNLNEEFLEYIKE